MLKRQVGGFNHCSLHCRLAKFRGFDVSGQIRRYDWPRNAYFSMCPVTISRL